MLQRRGSEESERADHPDSVVVTFELNFKKAAERHPLTTEILSFCAFLQPDAIPEELFRTDLKTFVESIAALRRYSLIKRDPQEKILSIHRLVQAVLIDKMPRGIQKQWRVRVVHAVNAKFPDVGFEDWEQHERSLPHALVCAAWTEDYLTPTQESTRLFRKVGYYLLTRGQYSTSEPLLERVLLLYKQHLGPESLAFLSVLDDLALLYSQQGKYGEAESLYHQCLAAREIRSGIDDPNTVSTLSALAFLYVVQGKDEQAEPLLVRARSTLEEQLGAEHPSLCTSLMGLANLYYKQGKYEQAEPLYRQTINIYERHVKVEHSGALFGLALLLHKKGQHEQAGALYYQSQKAEEQRLGATHPRIRESRKFYSEYLRSVGRNVEAAALEAIDESPE